MNEPIWVQRELAVALHDELIAEYGGLSGLRDDGLLESALARPQHLFGYGDDPSLAELAAAYAFGIARNHPFLDGNKRAALAVADVFLQLNGQEIDAPETEAVAIFRDLAAGELAKPELAAWIGARVIPR